MGNVHAALMFRTGHGKHEYADRFVVTDEPVVPWHALLVGITLQLLTATVALQCQYGGDSTRAWRGGRGGHAGGCQQWKRSQRWNAQQENRGKAPAS